MSEDKGPGGLRHDGQCYAVQKGPRENRSGRRSLVVPDMKSVVWVAKRGRGGQLHSKPDPLPINDIYVCLYGSRWQCVCLTARLCANGELTGAAGLLCPHRSGAQSLQAQSPCH